MRNCVRRSIDVTAQLPAVLDALALPEEHAAVRRLADAFGGVPAGIRERLVGEPARRSRRLLFASGGEIILHDDAVVAVLLHLEPTSAAPRGLDLSEWIAGAGNRATLDDLKEALGAPSHFAGFSEPYFTLDGAYARLDFRDRGWSNAGNLLSITFTVDKPGLACRPEDDDCLTCSDLLVRSSDGGVDVGSTIASLTTALTAGLLTEDAHWVKLSDLQALHASGLMERVESQLTCTTCRRIICFSLFRDSSPTFGYYVRNDAMRRPLEAMPPVAEWGDAARIAEDRDAMHYVDHEPGAWFLVEQRGVLHLQARYVITSMTDDSALICLDDSEVEGYRAGGRAFLSELADRIQNSAPHKEESRYYPRNLYRGPDGKAYREATAAAIINHTWLARQRQGRG